MRSVSGELQAQLAGVVVAVRAKSDIGSRGKVTSLAPLQAAPPKLGSARPPPIPTKIRSRLRSRLRSVSLRPLVFKNLIVGRRAEDH